MLTSVDKIFQNTWKKVGKSFLRKQDLISDYMEASVQTKYTKQENR